MKQYLHTNMHVRCIRGATHEPHFDRIYFGPYVQCPQTVVPAACMCEDNHDKMSCENNNKLSTLACDLVSYSVNLK